MATCLYADSSPYILQSTTGATTRTSECGCYPESTTIWTVPKHARGAASAPRRQGTYFLLMRISPLVVLILILCLPPLTVPVP
jgi:hypothetical protein